MAPFDPLSQRREDALARLDLARIYAQVLLFASSRARLRETGQELTQRVFHEAIDPEGRPWDPDRDPDFALFLMGRVRGGLAQDRKKLAVRANPRAVSAIEDRFYVPPPTPIDALERRRRAEQATRRWSELRASFDKKGDEFAHRVLDQYEAGTTDAAGQASALGAPIPDVYRERRRIARRARVLRDGDTDPKKPDDDGEVGT